jgi:hypothetical protein
MKGTLDFYRQAYENGELWSCCGYDGLSIVFDLPLPAVQSLAENQKRGLMGLLAHLAAIEEEDLRDEVPALTDQSSEDCVAVLLRLAARFAS